MTISENDIVETFCKKSKDKNLFKEIPVFARSVDLVECNKEDKEITAIEFKLTDWKTAIRQLLNVSSCFDRLALCIKLPKKESSVKKISDECSKHGIGLYFLDEKQDIFIHSLQEKKNNNVWNAMKKAIINYIDEL